MQSIASLVNLTARRIAKPDERDLGQARLGIEAVTALVDLLPAEVAAQIENALAELRMLFAKAASERQGGGAPPGEAAQGEGAPGEGAPGEGAPGGAGQGGGAGRGGEAPRTPQSPPEGGQPPRRGPEPPPRLWTPGSG
ncbi:MAG: hypothetical protein U0R52_01565 [Solirubrobacterales bacterium]